MTTDPISPATSAAPHPATIDAPSIMNAHELALRKLGQLAVGIAGALMLGVTLVVAQLTMTSGNWRVSFGLELAILFVGAAALQRRELVKRRMPQLFFWLHLGFAVALLAAIGWIAKPDETTRALGGMLGGLIIGMCGVVGRRAFKRLDLDAIRWQSGYPVWPIVVGALYIGAIMVTFFSRSM